MHTIVSIIMLVLLVIHDDQHLMFSFPGFSVDSVFNASDIILFQLIDVVGVPILDHPKFSKNKDFQYFRLPRISIIFGCHLQVQPF